jgi:hypothetical protein
MTDRSALEGVRCEAGVVVSLELTHKVIAQMTTNQPACPGDGREPKSGRSMAAAAANIHSPVVASR